MVADSELRKAGDSRALIRSKWGQKQRYGTAHCLAREPGPGKFHPKTPYTTGIISTEALADPAEHAPITSLATPTLPPFTACSALSHLKRRLPSCVSMKIPGSTCRDSPSQISHANAHYAVSTIHKTLHGSLTNLVSPPTDQAKLSPRARFESSSMFTTMGTNLNILVRIYRRCLGASTDCTSPP